MSDGLTHFQWLQAEKARIRSLVSKKISASALARLPKPIVAQRETLPPVVLATKAHATNPNRQEGSRASARARCGEGKVFSLRPKVDHAHLMSVIDTAARRFGQTAAKVCARRTDRAATAARHVAVLLALEVTKATQANLAAAMGMSLDTIKNSQSYGRSVITNYAGYAEKYGAAKSDILARWPQYRSAA